MKNNHRRYQKPTVLELKNEVKLKDCSLNGLESPRLTILSNLTFALALTYGLFI